MAATDREHMAPPGHAVLLRGPKPIDGATPCGASRRSERWAEVARRGARQAALGGGGRELAWEFVRVGEGPDRHVHRGRRSVRRRVRHRNDLPQCARNPSHVYWGEKIAVWRCGGGGWWAGAT
jgi:hypothetical protein